LRRSWRDLYDGRLRLEFKDGSLREETAVFSQRDGFRLERYRLVPRGPSFSGMEIAFDRRSGQDQMFLNGRCGGLEQTVVQWPR
jgi:hypothetical protein